MISAGALLGLTIPGTDASLAWNPALPVWILLPVVLVALGLIAYLYFEQRQMVSTPTVLLLTALRLGLVLLMLVLLLAPAMQWKRSRNLLGTLWLVVDQSPSMQASDPQASDIELLRWADALGYLPRSAAAKRSRADVHLARLSALRSAYFSLKPAALAQSTTLPPEEERQRVQGFAKALQEWSQQVGSAGRDMGKDAAIQRDGRSALDSISRIESEVDRATGRIRSLNTLRAATDTVNWATLQQNLDGAMRDLLGVALRADQQFLQGHATDAGVQSALARVKGLSRSERAFLAATVTGRDRIEGPALREVMDLYRVRIASFADTAQIGGTLESEGNERVESTLRNALSTNGQATSLSAGLMLAGQQIAADEPASVVILSDGRQNVPGDPTEPARLLASRGVKVFAIKTGSSEVSPDAAVEQVDAPEWIYKDDTLKASVLIRMDGLRDKQVKVELRRGPSEGGAVIDTQVVRSTANQHQERLTFTDRPTGDETSREYEVHVSQAAGESNLTNNRASFRVAIKKDKLFALVIDDRPRWEHRYVASYFSIDQRIKSQVVLLSPAEIVGVIPPKPVKASPANPRLEAQLLPETQEEWHAFDVIVLGDVPPEQLKPKYQQFIASAVRDKGATLITISGQRHMPAKFVTQDQPLSELLPVTGTAQWPSDAVTRHMRMGFRPALAPEGPASVLGQLGAEGGSIEQMWSRLTPWYWHSEFTQAKPGASVVWYIGELEGAGGVGPVGANLLETARRRALLSTMSVGLGRTLHMASDQTWRLRQINGVNMQEQFWGRALRWAVGSDLPAGGKFVRFGTNRPRYSAGEPVIVTARVLREDLAPYTGQVFHATAKLLPARDASGRMVGSPRNIGEARFSESAEAPGYYRATLGGLPAGEIEISLRGEPVERLLNDDPSVTQRTIVVTITSALNLEQRNMNTDGPLLERVAQAGGGFAVDSAHADVLAAHLPAIQQTITSVEELGFFTSPRSRGTHLVHWAFLVVFAALIGAEWMVRKMSGLV